MPTHEFVDKLCKHCGLPPDRAPPVCSVNQYGKPARRALDAIGLEYVGFETRGMYATYRSPLNADACERLFWPQIEKILKMLEELDALEDYRSEAAASAWYWGID